MAHDSEHGPNATSGTTVPGGTAPGNFASGKVPGSSGSKGAAQALGKRSAAGNKVEGAAAMPLESLSPAYVEGFHGTYLRRLEEAVKEPDNLNIALTGRYGAGKSSVLDKFQEKHHHATQRLAISTLAPGKEDESTTNRIQKEIVKQLVYGASEKVGKNSRFSQIAVLTRRRAFIESFAVVMCAAGLLYFFGWLPDVQLTGPGEETGVRVVAGVGAALLVAVALTYIRLITHGRFLSNVSAAGAGLTLSEKPESFFDKYLDEIVHYFESESKDIVIFEDLDRFEDPHIFEALRELNILLNETPKRRRKRRGNRLGRALRWLLAHASEDWPEKVAAKLPYWWATRLLGLGVPLRFVYAVKDSVFGKLDNDTATAATAGTEVPGSTEPTAPPPAVGRVDAAAAETLRANRTKFFDIVIPIVPFISHRNGRDLLLALLKDRDIKGIEPRLVNTVAQHCTDMRLMRNMCNEYLVFAERLLEPVEPNKKAPGMDESHLFALVAYKNFHLEDFENITRRDSDLDRLYEVHQRMVRETIADNDARKRDLDAAPERIRNRAQTAQMLGERLTRYARLVRRASPYGGSVFAFAVGSTNFGADGATGYRFWEAVSRRQSLDVTMENGNVLETLDHDALRVFAPEGLDAHRWADDDESDIDLELSEIERDIDLLRRADFDDLVAMPRFTLAAGDAPARQTFAELLTATLKSELARDLVRRGYIDRNFSLYAAQFYGEFTGVDVANFMVQHVQAGVMAVDYNLRRDGAVANLLAEAEQAGEELLATTAAYNIDIVDYLLAYNDERADAIVHHLISSGPDEQARTFLATYFTSGRAKREKLAFLLTAHQWREVFTYLAAADDVPTTARPALVNAALHAFDPDGTYDLDEVVREFITTHYRTMSAFTGTRCEDAAELPAERVVERLRVLLDHAGVIIPELDALDDHLRRLVVDANRYDITADNLRAALGISDAVPLDAIPRDSTVYAYCLKQLRTYLNAVDHDLKTHHAVNTERALITVLNDLVEDGWDEETAADTASDVADLLARTQTSARLTNLRSAPQPTWSALAAAKLFRVSLANVEAYRTHAGSIDEHLVAMLGGVDRIELDGPGDTADANGAEYDRQDAAVAVLNAPRLTAAKKVALVSSLDAPTPLPVDDIAATPDDLFALLLSHDMVDDDHPTFEHFSSAGWAAMKPAIAASSSIDTFVEPNLLSGMVSDLLADPTIATRLGRVITDNIDTYVPDDDWLALREVANYAEKNRVPLTPDTVVRIARTARENRVVNPKLMLRLLAESSPDAEPEHVIEVFTNLGTPYNDVVKPGAKFKVEYDAIHGQLLGVLKAVNLISRGTSMGKQHYTVTVSDA